MQIFINFALIANPAPELALIATLIHMAPVFIARVAIVLIASQVLLLLASVRSAWRVILT
jgi:hypothetical protein